MDLKIKPKYRVSNKEKFIAYTIASIGFLLLVLLIYNTFFISDEIYFEQNGVTLTESQYKAITSTVEDPYGILVCDLDNKGCIFLGELNEVRGGNI